MGTAGSDSDFFKKHPVYNECVLAGLQSLLLHMGVLPNEFFSKYTFHTSDLVAIICHDVDAFEAFCMLCLRHAVGSCSWKKEHCKTKVSKIFTLCDEAFAFLVLENNWMYQKAFYDRIQDDDKWKPNSWFMVAWVENKTFKSVKDHGRRFAASVESRLQECSEDCWENS